MQQNICQMDLNVPPTTQNDALIKMYNYGKIRVRNNNFSHTANNRNDSIWFKVSVARVNTN